MAAALAPQRVVAAAGQEGLLGRLVVEQIISIGVRVCVLVLVLLLVLLLLVLIVVHAFGDGAQRILGLVHGGRRRAALLPATRKIDAILFRIIFHPYFIKLATVH